MNGKVKPSGAAALAAVAPGLLVRKSNTIPGGVGTITEGAIAKRKASALRKANGFKDQITDLQIEIDRFKNSRDKVTAALRGEKDQLVADLTSLAEQIENAQMLEESLLEQILKLQKQQKLLLDEGQDTKDLTAELMAREVTTKRKTEANKLHISWAETQDQPKIDQLTTKRDKLISRLYHHQALHPEVINDQSTDAGKDSEAHRSAETQSSD